MAEYINKKAVLDELERVYNLSDCPAEFYNGYRFAMQIVNSFKKAEVEPVRCKDCKYWDDPICVVHSGWPDQYSTGHMDYTEPDAFCSYGERKDGGQAPQREDV